MKKITLLIVLLLLNAAPLLAADPPGAFFARYSYDPAFFYPGAYAANALYYRNPGNPNWQAGFSRDLSAVTCREAYSSIKRNGMWKGHLKQDGSCADPAEGVEWKVGNRLNFDVSIKQSGK